jgi:hypothetical protein
MTMTVEEKAMVQALVDKVNELMINGQFFTSAIECDAHTPFDAEEWKEQTVLSVHEVTKLLEGE